MAHSDFPLKIYSPQTSTFNLLPSRELWNANSMIFIVNAACSGLTINASLSSRIAVYKFW